MIKHQFKSNEDFTAPSHNGLILSVKNFCLTVEGQIDQVLGFGERFDSINHINKEFDNHVVDHFCNQDKLTYFPLPFFFIPNEFGVFINTQRAVHISSQEGIKIQLDQDDVCEITVFEGTPHDMISDFIDMTGKALLPPRWAFGPWMSAHRWNNEALVDEQLKIIKALNFPFTVMVLEQWSDEATFYIFNGASYHPAAKPKRYSDFHFDQHGPWKDPKKMIERIHQQGLKLLLWQIPVIKKLEPKDAPSLQHELDWSEVESNDLVARIPNGTAFTIPQGHWFPGSMIPDFSQNAMKQWWFDRRRYLLEIGVDGFKTDGGEHIYRDDIRFHSGETGLSMINQYSHDYIEAYRGFVGKERVLFSRAGYVGQQTVGIQWAGDQKSTWSEFNSIFRAGINCGLSGQAFWSFDIAGFAGDLPEPELYIRSTQLAVFTPVMQLHSEPVGGQFSLITKEKILNNERTPWNMASAHEDPVLIDLIRRYYWLRMNLLPHLYSESIRCVINNEVMMKHMMIDYPEDITARQCEDQYLFTNLLVAPVLNPAVKSRSVYFPKGTWFGLLTNTKFIGESTVLLETPLDTVLAFVKSGTALLVNSGDPDNLISDVGNDLEDKTQWGIRIYGEQGTHHFYTETEDFTISWANGHSKLEGNFEKDYPIKWIN